MKKTRIFKKRVRTRKPKMQYRSIKKPATFLSVTLTDAENAAKKIKTTKIKTE